MSALLIVMLLFAGARLLFGGGGGRWDIAQRPQGVTPTESLTVCVCVCERVPERALNQCLTNGVLTGHFMLV